MRSHELIEHTADVRLKVCADSLQELFYGALDGMALLLKPDSIAQVGSIKKDLSLTAPDATVLLIDFLSDVLMYVHIDHILFTSVRFSLLSETELSATIYGTPIDELDEDIKAVTYHEAQVVQNENGQWSTMIVFDI